MHPLSIQKRLNATKCPWPLESQSWGPRPILLGLCSLASQPLGCQHTSPLWLPAVAPTDPAESHPGKGVNQELRRQDEARKEEGAWLDPAPAVTA